MSEDWNEIIDTGFPGPGFKQIVAYGRGRGRGLLNINKENGVGLKSAVDSVNASQSWDGVQGGFGKKTFQKSNTASTDWAGNPPQAAFGNKVFGSSDGTSDDWNDNRPTEGGFGSKGFGVPNNSTADWSDNKTSHGGFGQKSFGIRNTFSQESAETKPGFGGFRKNADENWGDSNSQQQHTGFDRKIFRSVPNGNAENRSGFGRGETRMSGRTSDRGCFKCGEHGHISRDCPQGGGGSGRGGACYRCGEEGHISRDCPQGGGGSSRSGACYRCGEEGHISRDCPQGGGRQGGRSGPSGTCYNCGEAGHMARDCPNSRSGSARPGQGEKQPENYIPPPPPESEDEIFQSVQQGINFDKYDNIKVFVTGRNAPQTGVSCFSEAGLHDVIAKNVQKARYLKPTPVQKHAIPVIMNDRDLMACAQTGSGKTAAFLLPVLTKMIENGLHGSSFSEIQEPQTMVIGPTRELVVQIYNEARKFAFNTSLRPVVVYGGTSVGHQLQQISKGAHMVVGTPGRLKDFIERGKISLSKVRFLILDEADRMLDMGFEPVVRQIVEQMGMTPKSERQTLMFSATFPEEIQKLASDFLKDHIFITVGRVGGANTDIKQIVYQVEKNEKREKLVSILNETGTSRALVFVEQKRSTDFLAAFLCQFDFPATSIHGDRYQSQREEALADFKSGRKPILVATSVASRGLDIRGVEHVINFDMPKSIDEYVHRIGRTGRCGNLGKATSFFDPQVDNDIAQPLVSILVDAQQEVPEWLADIADRNSCGFVPSGGKYGGRDIRRKQYKDDRNSDFNSRGFNEGTLPNTVVDDEEVWDD